MNLDVFTVINQKYNTFSKVNKIIADFVLTNHSSIVFLTISKFSELLNVSPASITRFSKELGYKGFPDFQNSLQNVLKKEIIDRKEIRMSLLDDTTDDVLTSIVNDNIENLNQTLTVELIKEFNNAVKEIVKAERVYIIGLRSSYTVAYYFYFLLREILNDVTLLTLGTGDIYDQILNINSECLVISIGFPKYTKYTCDVVNYFSKKNARTIAITDSYSSPLSVSSDITLIAANRRNSYSFVSAMSIANALVVSIGKLSAVDTIEALDKKELLLLEKNIHL